jgi:hypothetical protein
MKKDLDYLTKFHGLLFSLLFVIAFSSGYSTLFGQIEKSGEWERIQNGEYLLENCTWNVNAAKSKWSQTIFCDTVKGIFGWKWDFSGEKEEENSYVIKTYPEIIFGRKPYENYKSTTNRLPVPLTSAKFRLEYDYFAKSDGAYNTTTDISFTDNINPGPANIRAKMMIWFDRQEIPFFNSRTIKQATIGGLPCDVFIDPDHTGPEGKWVFIALLLHEFPNKGELDLNEYFNYALSKGALKPEWFLSSIEIGSEIATGKGKIIFNRFVVH